MNNNKVYTVYGINSSISVIKAASCKVRQIVLTKNSNAFKTDKLNQSINNNNLSHKVKLIDYSKSNKNISNRSQGVVIEFEYYGIKETLEDLLKNDDENSCVLILDQLEDPQNLGQIIRTCECAGVDKIILTQNRSVKLSDVSLQISQGAFTNISFYICTNLRSTLELMKKYNYWMVALENGINANEWHKVDLKGKIGIILGSEGKGIRRLTLENSDFQATIPMQGEINSLNVSATCSAILFERLRQVLTSK
tara:strand:+ start:88 stop:843 length:756 start_codon:yes stop_codon:yes gene_type:complete